MSLRVWWKPLKRSAHVSGPPSLPTKFCIGERGDSSVQPHVFCTPHVFPFDWAHQLGPLGQELKPPLTWVFIDSSSASLGHALGVPQGDFILSLVSAAYCPSPWDAHWATRPFGYDDYSLVWVWGLSEHWATHLMTQSLEDTPHLLSLKLEHSVLIPNDRGPSFCGRIPNFSLQQVV